MTMFSDREGFTSRSDVVEDAPEWLRNAYFHQVLKPFLHLDRTSDSFASATDSISRPLGIKTLVEKFSTMMRLSPPEGYLSDATCVPALFSQLQVCPWFHFYNSIELAGHLLKLSEENHNNINYGISTFLPFLKRLNSFFEEAAVGWRLNEAGVLERRLPKEISEIENALLASHSKDPVSTQLKKARGFINQHPCDAANAIKESVSAIESVGRILAPKAKTLGDAVGRLRANSQIPQLLLTVIKKLYAFASAEPAVRHGSAEHEKVTRKDAEFVFITSLAIIQYMHQESGA